MKYCFKKIFVFVIVLFFVLDGLYARGIINVTKQAASHVDDAGRIIVKTTPDIIKPALSHTDDALKIGRVSADDIARLTMLHADDASRLGLRQGDNIIYNFSQINRRTHSAYRHIPRTNGRWNGIPGDSIFLPNLNHIPQPGKQMAEIYSRPRTWKEIGEQNIIQVRNISEIPQERRLLLAENYRKFSSGEIGFNYKNGEVDFLAFSYDTIDVRTIGHDRIPEWRYIRDDPLKQGRSGVMDIGDAALAKKWNWSVGEVRAFMQKNGLTWHERMDLHSLDMVPVDLHLISHQGGHAAVNALVSP